MASHIHHVQLLLGVLLSLLHAHVHEGTRLVHSPGTHTALSAVELQVRHAEAQGGMLMLLLGVADHVRPVTANIRLHHHHTLVFKFRVAAAGIVVKSLADGFLLLLDSVS